MYSSKDVVVVVRRIASRFVGCADRRRSWFFFSSKSLWLMMPSSQSDLSLRRLSSISLVTRFPSAMVVVLLLGEESKALMRHLWVGTVLSTLLWWCSGAP